MTFLSFPFLLLFISVMAGLAVLKSKESQQRLLLMASYIFYGFWDVRFLGLMLLLTFVSFKLALKIECVDPAESSRRKLLTGTGVAVSIAVLCFFKYWNFFRESFFRLFRMDGGGSLNIILPVGISFYTFQALSYLIDVYRGKVQARRSFTQISLYIAFFPQLVAGPIVRSSDFLPQLDEAKRLTKDNLSSGMQIFLFGVIKKAVIADRMAVCVDSVYGAWQAYSGLTLLAATVAYAIQIYCDFSGYSDMAIGAARMMGYRLCKNFDIPYLASNPSEFWRRWHISLSSWFRDYVYIPLGGSRKGRTRTCLNLILTMVLSGLWHGANWTFLFWGGFHGAVCAGYRLYHDWKKGMGFSSKTEQTVLKAGGRYVRLGVKAMSVVFTFSYVCIGWIFFRAGSIREAFCILGRIVSLAAGVSYFYVFLPVYGGLILAACLWAYFRHNKAGYYPIMDTSKFGAKLIICIVIWLILAFYYPGENAFIYFQF